LGTIFGSRVLQSGQLRLSVVAGSLILIVTTAAMLLIGVATPGWLTALILCGRGLALGLVTTPLLVGVMGSLPQSEVADGSTVFNVAQRLAASFGIGLLATFFAIRVTSRVQDALRSFGVPAPSGGTALGGSVSGSLAKAPPPLRAAIDAALASAFHDVVWALVAVSAVGLVLALFIREGAAERNSQLQPAALET
jgi:hypothetical protein